MGISLVAVELVPTTLGGLEHSHAMDLGCHHLRRAGFKARGTREQPALNECRESSVCARASAVCLHFMRWALIEEGHSISRHSIRSILDDDYGTR